MTTILAVVWAVVVALTAARFGSQPSPGGAVRSGPGRRRGRLGSPLGAGAQDRSGGPSQDRRGRLGPPRERLRPLQRLGLAVAGGAVRAVGRSRPAPADPGAIGAGALLAVLVLVAMPGLWPAAAVMGVMPPLLARGRRRQARAAAARAVLDELPEVVDLLSLAVAAGLTAPLAVAAVGRRGPGSLAGALGQACEAAAVGGRRLADVLDDVPAALGEAGDGARPLLAALADAARHGTALGPGLDRLAAQARTSRRQRAEERARRVPILLLFPLVTCTLPALGLLSIAPLAVAAIADLQA